MKSPPRYAQYSPPAPAGSVCLSVCPNLRLLPLTLAECYPGTCSGGWAFGGYPAFLSPDGTRRTTWSREKRKRGKGNGREEEEIMVMKRRKMLRLQCWSLSLRPTLREHWAKHGTAEHQSWENPPTSFSPPSSPLLSSRRPPLPSLRSVMQSRCNTFCTTWGFKAPERLSQRMKEVESIRIDSFDSVWTCLFSLPHYGWDNCSRL